MEHLALYRKWRPQNFKSLIGQEDNLRVLKNAVLRGRTVHAYLFCGTRGTGKTSTARILAKALNCEHPVDGEPCNECEICRGITEGRFMDVIEIDAASNRGIDEVRDLLEKVHFVPVKGKYKVYIIDEAHMLTTEAFNALLKTFEEPPSHVVFILATTEARKIPMTILSRCQRYDFKSINEETLRAALKNIADAEGVEADEDAIALLAEKARGSMRDALSLMDQAMGSEKIMTAEELNRLTGSVPYEFWPGFFRSVAANDLPSVFASLDEVERQGKDLRQFFRDFRDFAGDLISAAVSGGESRYQRILKECASLFTPSQILEIITVCGESEIVFRYNRDGKAVCRFLMARIMKSLYPAAVPERTAPAAEPASPPVKRKPAPPVKDYVFPNETIGEVKAADTVQERVLEKNGPASPVKESPADLPPWETMPSLDDLVPPPEEEPALPDLPSFSEKPGKDENKTAPVMAEPDKEKPAERPVKEEPPKEELPAESAPAMTKVPRNESADADAEVLWAKLLKAVKASSPSTFTWLSHGEYGKATDAELMVNYDPHDGLFLDKVKEPAHTAVIEKEIKNVFGRELRFHPQSAGEKNTEELSLF
ncbi:MAG: DNA polymerase III subunit gamma/tau [Clostridia bacterium]